MQEGSLVDKRNSDVQTCDRGGPAVLYKRQPVCIVVRATLFDLLLLQTYTESYFISDYIYITFQIGLFKRKIPSHYSSYLIPVIFNFNDVFE
jgi:hypothetical protein